jgi:hypothetical protein
MVDSFRRRLCVRVGHVARDDSPGKKSWSSCQDRQCIERALNRCEIVHVRRDDMVGRRTGSTEGTWCNGKLLDGNRGTEGWMVE